MSVLGVFIIMTCLSGMSKAPSMIRNIKAIWKLCMLHLNSMHELYRIGLFIYSYCFIFILSSGFVDQIMFFLFFSLFYLLFVYVVGITLWGFLCAFSLRLQIKFFVVASIIFVYIYIFLSISQIRTFHRMATV